MNRTNMDTATRTWICEHGRQHQTMGPRQVRIGGQPLGNSGSLRRSIIFFVTKVPKRRGSSALNDEHRDG